MKIFIENPDHMYISLMRDCGFDLAFTFLEADALLFTGGTDVNPGLYGEERDSHTDMPDANRDALCVNMYEYGEANKKLMFGICRGSQFLTVMQGGTLMQHVPWHRNGKHNVMLEDSSILEVTSSHHQLMVPNRGFTQVIAAGYDGSIEATKTYDGLQLAVQGHPEWCEDTHDFYQWYRHQTSLMVC